MKIPLIVGVVAALLATTAPAQAADLSEAIRKEGLENSHAMEFAAELTDGIGARLTGSPNMRKAYDWSLAKFRTLGAANSRLEDAGEFGLSWRQNNTWLRMSAPDSMVFLAQASPWSVSSHGPKSGEAVAVELASPADFVKYRGTLRGKIVLLGPLRATLQTTSPFTRRWSDEDLASGKAAEPQLKYHLNRKERLGARAKNSDFGAEISVFLRDEGVLAVVLPSRETTIPGGGTGHIMVDLPPFSSKGWTVATRAPFPLMVTSIESFGRAWRLAKAGTPVQLEFDVDTTTFGEHERAYNVIAEIPGVDPQLKAELVMLGAHLDSWGPGTGAADNAAGVAASLEVVRILKAVGAKPRRTIRIALFSGEEQGMVGSSAYVAKHFGYSTGVRPTYGDVIARADLKTLPEHSKLSAYYNLDHGAGKIRGVFAGGNVEVGKIFAEWIKPLSDLGVEKVFEHRYFPADQASFEAVNLPGISFLQDGLDYDTRAHHSNLDTLERVSPADLAQVSTVLAIFVLNTANRDDMMPRLSQDPER